MKTGRFEDKKAKKVGVGVGQRVLVHGVRHFSKANSSSFANSDFSGYLKVSGIHHVVICGVYAEGCVRVGN
jgi:isochorismate hydrolase